MAARFEAGRKHLDVGGLTASDKLGGSWRRIDRRFWRDHPQDVLTYADSYNLSNLFAAQYQAGTARLYGLDPVWRKGPTLARSS